MLVISGLFVAALTGQSLAMPPSSPAVECSEYLTDWRARRNCLRGLLSEAGDGLDDAVDAARAEADEIDMDSGGSMPPRRPGWPIATPSVRAGLRPCSCPQIRARRSR